MSINRYFARHPEMVLGEMSIEDTLYDGEGISVKSNGDLEKQLWDAVYRLPYFAPIAIDRTNRATVPTPSFNPPPLDRHVGEGSFFVAEDRRICQMVNGQAVPVVYGGTTLRADGTMTGKRVAALIGLRDRARRVLKSQNDDWPEKDRTEARRELNWAYDRFVMYYGPINKTTISEAADGSYIRRMPNIVKFREDPDAMLVMSLEDYDELTGKARKADIMTRDVVGKTPPVTQVNSAEEGLLVSLNQRGVVDLPYIAELYGKPENQIIAELGDLIYLDPESKSWQTADAYLSGNVREKLANAKRAGQEYARNAEALRAVQPEDVLPGDIDAGLVRRGFRLKTSGNSRPNSSARRHFDPGLASGQGCRLEARCRLCRRKVRRRHERVRHVAGQRHVAFGTGPQHENAGHLRHDHERWPRGTGRQSGSDIRRQGKAAPH